MDSERAVWVTVDFTPEEYHKIESVKEILSEGPATGLGGSGGRIEFLDGTVRMRIPFTLDETAALRRRQGGGDRRGEPVSLGELVRRVVLSMLERYSADELASMEAEKREVERREIARLSRLMGTESPNARA